MLENELFISFKFSLLEIKNTETIRAIINATGMNIIIDIFSLIKNI